MGCNGDCDHTQMHSELCYRLDRQTELLALVANVLAPARHHAYQQAIANANGRAYVDLLVAPGGDNLQWLVERFNASTNSTGSPTFTLYVMDSLPLTTNADFDRLYMVDFTALPTAAADETNPISLVGGQHLVGQWLGCSTNAVCKANAQYRQAWAGQD